MKRAIVILFVALVLALVLRATCATADEYRVRINTPLPIEWSQLTFDYDSTAVRFTAAAWGVDVVDTGPLTTNDGPGTPGFPVSSAEANRHVVLNGVGDIGPGCALHLWTVSLDVADPNWVWATWDRRVFAGNSPSHFIAAGPILINAGVLAMCDYWNGTDAGCMLCVVQGLDISDPIIQVWLERVDTRVVSVYPADSWGAIKGLYR